MFWLIRSTLKSFLMNLQHIPLSSFYVNVLSVCRAWKLKSNFRWQAVRICWPEHLFFRLHVCVCVSFISIALRWYIISGYGCSNGKPSEKNLYADIAAALAALRSRYQMPLNRIVLYGQSIGMFSVCLNPHGVAYKISLLNQRQIQSKRKKLTVETSIMLIYTFIVVQGVKMSRKSKSRVVSPLFTT